MPPNRLTVTAGEAVSSLLRGVDAPDCTAAELDTLEAGCKDGTLRVVPTWVLEQALAAIIAKCGDPTYPAKDQITFGCCGSKSATDGLRTAVINLRKALSADDV